MNWLQVVGLIVSLLKWAPKLMLLFKDGQALWSAIQAVKHGHAETKLPPVHKAVNTLKDVHAVIAHHVDPETTVVVHQTPNEEAMNADVKSDDFQRILHPDTTDVPDYLKKYL